MMLFGMLLMDLSDAAAARDRGAARGASWEELQGVINLCFLFAGCPRPTAAQKSSPTWPSVKPTRKPV